MHGGVDYNDAMIIERAIVSLPAPTIALLRLFYLTHAHPSTIRRVLRRHYHVVIKSFETSIQDAQQALAIALNRTVAQNRAIARSKAKITLDVMIAV